jgi:hypothetical protein
MTSWTQVIVDRVAMGPTYMVMAPQSSASLQLTPNLVRQRGSTQRQGLGFHASCGSLLPPLFVLFPCPHAALSVHDDVAGRRRDRPQR